MHKLILTGWTQVWFVLFVFLRCCNSLKRFVVENEINIMPLNSCVIENGCQCGGKTVEIIFYLCSSKILNLNIFLFFSRIFTVFTEGDQKES